MRRVHRRSHPIPDRREPVAIRRRLWHVIPRIQQQLAERVKVDMQRDALALAEIAKRRALRLRERVLAAIVLRALVLARATPTPADREVAIEIDTESTAA